MFNLLGIVGVAATITPIAVSGAALWIALGAGTLAVIGTWPGARESLGRGRGVLLIMLYALTLSLLAVFSAPN